MKTTKHNITNTAEPIKPGYKKTSVGMIPEDWEVKRIGDLGDVVTGSTPKTTISEYYNGDELFVSPVDIQENTYVNQTEKTLTELGIKQGRLIPKNSILFVCIGSTIGKVSISGKNLITNQQINSVIPNKQTHFYYLFNILKQKAKSIKLLAANQAVPILNKSEFSKIRLPIPPLPEQKAIADCLSTWDKAIEKLSALIAAKKEQKKGLMQGLFSGELKVENGELVKIEDEKLWLKGWEEVRLGDIGVFRTSSVNKKIVESETKVWLLNYMDVYKNTHITSEIEFQLTSAKDSQIESSNLMIGDVLFTPSSETPDDIGHSAVVTENLENVVFSYHLVRFRVKRNLLDIDFSGHVFNKSDILNEFSRRATGSTRYTLSLKDFNEITTKLPELNEQKAISSVLTTADKEIELLEKKLEIFKIQKKGLMQVLLTGERRLV